MLLTVFLWGSTACLTVITHAGEVITQWLCSCQNLSISTDLHAANGKRVKALDIFAYALAFFKEQALKVRRESLVPEPRCNITRFSGR